MIFSKSKNWVLTFSLILRFCFLKRKNQFLTFCLTMLIFSKVRIEFLLFPTMIACLFVCLFAFLKSKNWDLTFYLPCDFFFQKKGSGFNLFPYHMILFCFVLFCFLFCFVLFCLFVLFFVLFCFVLFCFFEKKVSSSYLFPYPWDFFEK